MRAIIEYSEANLKSTVTVVDNFPREEHVKGLFDEAKRLADIIHMGFMTAIFEVYTARLGGAYDGSWMEAWDPERVQSGLDSEATVVCTTELGLRALRTPSTSDDYPFIKENLGSFVVGGLDLSYNCNGTFNIPKTC